MLKDLVAKCRSYRRFFEEVSIPYDQLEDMVDTARITASTANSQLLKYKIICEKDDCRKVFPHLAWAGALKDWDGPGEGERPSAYILILADLTIAARRQWDEGIAAQTILLRAVEKGYGGCMIGSVKRTELLHALGLDPERYQIGLALALGKPKEKIMLVDAPKDGPTTYYRDENQVHYVPKRSLEDILL